jgi:hypothetical protein
MKGILLVIQLILGGLDMISRNLLLHSLPLNHCHPVIFSWFIIHIHCLMARLLEIPVGNPSCRRSTNPSLRTKLGIWFPFLMEGKLSGVDGSTRPREQWMDRLAYTKPDNFPKVFSRLIQEHRQQAHVEREINASAHL